MTLSRLALALLALTFAVSAYSQGGGDVGNIVGAITDASGGAISGATVTVLDVQRGTTRTLLSDSAGQYSAPNLTPGTYTVKVEFMGFATTQRQNILLQVGQEIRADFTMQPGQQTQTITVTEQIPLVEVTNAVLGGALNNQLIADLPLNGRNYTRLLDLQPGVYVAPGSGKWSQSSNGMRAEHNVYILDGVDTIESFSSQSVLNSSPVFGDATSILPIDAIQEFNTEQNPTAEYGWKPGAIVNIGLKSGTNALHGTADAFGRDSDLDATNPFIPPGGAKQQTAIETFGATVGGPIIKDKMFFFMGYEGQLNHISAPSSAIVFPTTNPLTGNSLATSQSLVAACNALTSAPNALSLKLSGVTYSGPGNCGVSAPYSGVFQTGPSDNYAVTPIGNDKLNNGLGKVDYHLNAKNTLSGEYFEGNFDGLGFQGSPGQPYWDTQAHARSIVVGAHWTYLPGSTIVNEAHFGLNRFYQPSYPGDCGSIGQPSGEAGINWGTSNEVIPQTGEPANCGIPPITISGFSATGCCNSFPKIQGPDYTIQFVDTLSYIRGKHSMKFGGEARHEIFNGGTYSGSRGTYTFSATGTGASTVTALQNFLLGNLSSSTLPQELYGTPNVNVTDSAFSLFAQDDWRVTHRFTVNLGLRFERVTSLKEANDQLANFDPQAPTGMVQLGQTPKLYPNWNNYSPRVGFAWDVTGNSKWVVRGGANIIYVLEGFNVFLSQQGTHVTTTGLNTTPTAATLINSNGVSTPGPGNIETALLSFSSGVNWGLAGPVFPAVTNSQLQCASPVNASPNNNPCAILAVDPHLRRPYAPAWNLGIQHAFSNNLSLQAVYVGTHGTGLVGLNDVNPAAPNSGWQAFSGTGATATCTPYTAAQMLAGTEKISTQCENMSRPYFKQFPYLANINQIQNLDKSNYDALQVTLTQRPWHGFNYILGYVYSHSLEMGSGDWNGANVPSNVYNPQLDYGDASTDVRDSLTWSLTYALPNKKGFGQLLEGWRINSVLKYQTALPWNVVDTTNNINGTGEGNDRWDFFGNPAAFSDIGSGSVNAAGVPQGIPYFTGATNPACAAQAASLDAANKPVAAGYTYTNALVKYGCYAQNGAIMLPPAFGTFGTMGRELFRGNPFKLWDVSISKDVRFSERFTGQFRLEAFNVLNQTQFAVPTGAAASPTSTTAFGASRQTPDVAIANATVGSGADRSLQIGFRLVF